MFELHRSGIRQVVAMFQCDGFPVDVPLNHQVIRGAESNAWCECGEEASKKLGIDLEVHRVGADGLTDPNGGFLSSFGIDPTGTVLVRPDGFVAWRAKTGEGASAARMESALSTILSR